MAHSKPHIMQTLAKVVDGAVNEPKKPKTTGFVILKFPLDQIDSTTVDYVSSGNRKDMIAAMKEIVARLEGQAQVSGRA
jgi:hypothetical protein